MDFTYAPGRLIRYATPLGNVKVDHETAIELTKADSIFACIFVNKSKEIALFSIF
jgi:predicted class III extradiol MEMO1 family dioxygenase